MAQNTAPIFPRIPVTHWNSAALLTAVVAKDGTGLTDSTALVFTAHATEGSRVDYLKVRAIGTNVVTVMRVFINNGSTAATAANNVLFMERTIAATTISEVAEQVDNVIPMNISLDAGFTIRVSIGTSVAAGLRVTTVGGHY